MTLRSTATAVRALDGLRLAGTLVTPGSAAERAVVLVHGGGVTREEGGFFTRLAAGLGEAGVASLRCDLRGHGESEGQQQETTLSAHLNDIRAIIDHLREATEVTTISLLGASFGGGLCTYYAAKQPEHLTRLVLLNPQLDYKNRYVDQKPYWSDDRLNDDAAQELREQGYISHSPTVKHGRAFLNEVFWIRPHLALGEIQHLRSSRMAPRTRLFPSNRHEPLSTSSPLNTSSSRSKERNTASRFTTTPSTLTHRAKNGRHSLFAL
jgi:pimeloyl-ACP methyl ester carboxylesterase